MQSGEGRFRYFAGGFPTDSLARAAVEQLRRAGFRAPHTVVWIDGVFIDPAATDAERIYRVEIAGVETLPDMVRELAAAADIVRSAEACGVTPLDAAAAIRLRTDLEALGADHPEWEIKLSKIAE